MKKTTVREEALRAILCVLGRCGSFIFVTGLIFHFLHRTSKSGRMCWKRYDVIKTRKRKGKRKEGV